MRLTIEPGDLGSMEEGDEEVDEGTADLIVLIAIELIEGSRESGTSRTRIPRVSITFERRVGSGSSSEVIKRGRSWQIMIPRLARGLMFRLEHRLTLGSSVRVSCLGKCWSKLERAIR